MKKAMCIAADEGRRREAEGSKAAPVDLTPRQWKTRLADNPFAYSGEVEHRFRTNMNT